MEREVLVGRVRGEAHPHEGHELLGEVLVALAVVAHHVPDPEAGAENVRDLVSERADESGIRMKRSARVLDERVISQEEMPDPVDVESPQ